MNEINLKLKSYEELQETVTNLSVDNFFLVNKLEAYENMRKEVNIFIKKKQKLGALNYVDINDLLNILNKVGGSDE